jgi:hypothetical protein
MTERPYEQLKPVVGRLAEVLAGNDGAAILALMQRAGLLTAPPAPGAKAGEDEGVRVGVWTRQGEGAAARFVRRESAQKEWSLWADVAEIPPKGTKKRIALLGESVARGFYLDPHFSPSIALEGTLAAAVGRDEVEVVDLGRIDLTRRGLLELAQAALALQPDALVIMAGNNWSPVGDLQPGDVNEVARLLRGGLPPVKAFLEGREALFSRFSINFLGRLAAQAGIPVVFVLPEYNLAGWQPEVRGVPFLPDRSSTRWDAAWEAAQTALAAGDLDTAEAAGRELVDIDQGIVGAGPSILARCALKRGQAEEARRFLEMARDAEIWMSLPLTPRVCGATQNAIRAAAPAAGLQLVDLPLRFGEYLEGALPDDRLFLDFCHLSAEGIRVSMAAAAEPLLRALWGKERSWRALLAEGPSPSGPAQARAQLRAALYASWHGQPTAALEARCLSALRDDPALADTMLDVLELCHRRLPLLSSAFNRLVGRDAGDARWYGTFLFAMQHASLADAIVRTLATVRPEAAARCEEVRRSEYGVNAAGRDLLDPRASVHSRLQLDGMVGGGFYRAYGRESRFLLTTSGPGPVELDITYRVAPGAVAEPVEIRLNGAPVQRVETGLGWSTVHLELSARALRPGLNELVVRWPALSVTGEAGLAAAARKVELGLAPEPPYPLFGMIHALTARAPAAR